MSEAIFQLILFYIGFMATAESHIHGEDALKDPYKNFNTKVISVTYKVNGPKNPSETWRVDCNERESIQNSYLIGIHTSLLLSDDHDWFTEIDAVKCIGGTNAYSDVFRLDRKQNVVIRLSPLDKDFNPECPEDYVLTALWDFKLGWPHVQFGKCTKLKYSSLDRSHCRRLPAIHGGPRDEQEKWQVECPFKHAMTGLRRDYQKTDHITCCPEKHEEEHHHTHNDGGGSPYGGDSLEDRIRHKNTNNGRYKGNDHGHSQHDDHHYKPLNRERDSLEPELSQRDPYNDPQPLDDPYKETKDPYLETERVKDPYKELHRDPYNDPKPLTDTHNNAKEPYKDLEPVHDPYDESDKLKNPYVELDKEHHIDIGYGTSSFTENFKSVDQVQLEGIIG
ncbi:unnamed protein product [Cyprideis torosa]|uniref:Uncharacterized protein n=1 Tax=Cyprideis torosa TaxID=163714 RepID=A0A7R8W9M4_9CRUS|nr:unnamed protein product [Cyprideis torosa]CAG0884459.1 unnamed protein product [Cyprideis torosa]